MGTVERLSKYRLDANEIPKKLDPRPTSEILETLLREVAVGDIIVMPCSWCNGSGKVNIPCPAQHHGHDVTVKCGRCNGTGTRNETV